MVSNSFLTLAEKRARARRRHRLDPHLWPGLGPNAHKPFTIDDYGKLRKKSYLTYMADTYKTKRKLQEAADGWKEKRPEGEGYDMEVLNKDFEWNKMLRVFRPFALSASSSSKKGEFVEKKQWLLKNFSVQLFSSSLLSPVFFLFFFPPFFFLRASVCFFFPTLFSYITACRTFAGFSVTSCATRTSRDYQITAIGTRRFIASGSVRL